MINNVFCCFYACDDNYDLSKDETLYVIMSCSIRASILLFGTTVLINVFDSAERKSEFVMLLNLKF